LQFFHQYPSSLHVEFLIERGEDQQLSDPHSAELAFGRSPSSFHSPAGIATLPLAPIFSTVVTICL
jgi:hypothetical protein